MKNKNNQRGFAPIIIILAVAVILVAGYVWWAKNHAPASRNPDVSVSTSTAQTDTTGWKAYRNAGYGYELQYPPNFTLIPEPASNRISISKKGDKNDICNLEISELVDRGQLTMSQFIHNDTSYDNAELAGEHYQQETRGFINGVQYFRYLKILGSSNEFNYFFEKDGNHGIYAGYTNEWAKFTGVGKNPYGKIFEEILSTFKFTR